MKTSVVLIKCQRCPMAIPGHLIDEGETEFCSAQCRVLGK